MLKGFDPIIAKDPKVMILGSMPSVTSLEKQEYYGFKHNRFWKIMADVFACELNDYEDKKQVILNHHMILWDVIGMCERNGSLDSAIRNEVCNPIDELIHTYPTIQKVICNGRKSYDLYQKHFSFLDVTCIYLPSTSNANRSIKEDVLFEAWRKELSPYL